MVPKLQIIGLGTGVIGLNTWINRYTYDLYSHPTIFKVKVKVKVITHSLDGHGLDACPVKKKSA